LIFDAIGIALAGHQGEETPQIAAFARQLGSAREATVIGGEPLSVAGATVLNGYLISAITAIDAFEPAMCHMMPEILPPALAVGERDDVSGEQFLVAITAGLEVATRVAIGLNYPAFRARGWHAPGVVGPFGAAAAVGKLLRLDAHRQNSAFGLAGSQAAGTFAAWGTPTVKFHQCRGALSGLMAGLLGEQGFAASAEILAHPDGGIFNSYSDGGDPEAVVRDLGQRWDLEQISLRLWPCAVPTLLTALFDLIQEHDLEAEDVERVQLVVSEEAQRAHRTFSDPRGRFEAMLSLEYIVAVVLHDRAAWLEQFGPGRYNDAGLRRFMQERVVVASDTTFPRHSMRLEVRTLDGRDLSVHVDHAKGSPGNRATRAELIEKFRRCAEGKLPADTAERVLECVFNLEQLGSIRRLTGLLERS
jgi:2-methylcitrate dehydratase PrpD